MPNHSPLEGNRFSALMDTTKPRPKKRRQNITDEVFPKLPTISSQTRDPKFVIIKSSDDKNSLSKLSVFAKKKYIDGISLETESISMLRDGSLLILTKSQLIADKFLKIKKFGESCPVTVSLHAKLNSCQGIIYDRNLIDVSEEEIIADLKDQGVSSIYKFSKFNNNIKTYTGAILITFNLFKLPASLNVAWYKLKVKEFFPNPMRCKNCQQLGHTQKHCRNNTTCNICNLPPHNPEKCTRDQCANCYGPHPASSSDCPKYQQLKEILKIQTKNKCTIYEARKLYFQHNPPSIQLAPSLLFPHSTYAAAASNTNNNNNNSNKNNNESNSPQKSNKTASNNNDNSPQKTNKLTNNNNTHNTNNPITTYLTSNSHSLISKPVLGSENNSHKTPVTAEENTITSLPNNNNANTRSEPRDSDLVNFSLTQPPHLPLRRSSPSVFLSSDSEIEGSMT